jgi:amino acid transporter
MFLAIALVMLLYLAIALAVFGNLDLDRVIQAKDFALAEAARPVFGTTGFTVVAIAALISTASSINANLYAVTNVTYQLARDGELPCVFGEPIGHSREGLVISGVLIILMTDLLDLSEIAAVGSIAILIVHLVVHLGHLRVREETQASLILLLSAIASVVIALAFAVTYSIHTSPHILLFVAIALACAFVTESVLYRFTSRRIRTRI